VRVALISSVGQRCGISSYAENLIPELGKHCQLRVFPEGDLWNREDNFKLPLLEEIVRWGADVAVFNHEFGLFPKSYQISTLTSYLRWKKIKTVAIFHSTYSNHKDKSITESSFDHLIVHTEGAKNALIKKGIRCPIDVVPHGTEYRDELLEPLWKHIGAPAVTTMGFSFFYKNWVGALDIIAKLKEKWEDVQYIILASMTDKNIDEHNAVFDAVMRRAEELDLLGNLTLNKGFFSEELLLSYLRVSDVCLLNYKVDPEHELFAASGISKICIQTKVPVVVSGHSLFEDLKGLSLRGDSDEEIVNHISNIFQGKYAEDEINEKRLKFLQENCWQNAARKIIEIL